MNFSVHQRDGPARIGELIIDEMKVTTPNILFLQTSRCPSPAFADILITQDSKKYKKPVVRIGTSVFSSESPHQKKGFCVDRYLLYPKDVSPELHREALSVQKKKSDCIIVPCQRDLISDVVKNTDATIFIVGNATQLSTQQTAFVDFIVELRTQIGYQKLLYLPCVGDPMSLAFLTYLGVDVFDSFAPFQAARHETFLFPTGSYQKNELPENPCTCPVCMTNKKPVSEMTFQQILTHNYYAFISEIKHVRNAIISGGLRELAETRVRANPQLAAMLKLLDRNHYRFLEERTPITRKHELRATTKEALTRPEVRRFQERVIHRYTKPQSTRVLLLLPCSAKKPYSFSPSHKLFRERLFGLENPFVVHEIIITSPLGIVPRELELTYPASAYDIAVTGLWDEDEKKMIRTLLQQYLKKNHYDTVVLHVPSAIQEFIIDVINNPVVTCLDFPTSDKSLDTLSDVVQKIVKMYDKGGPQIRTAENIHSLASYQFGQHLADHLLSGSTIQGKYPYQKIMQNSRQLGMITQERGLISLTLHGAERLAASEQYWVEISDDFTLKGSVFAPGIKDADPFIRVGDEVIIKRKDVCGVGVALMNGQEMKESNHGEAVKVRHHL